jgi:hypothetical protein
MYAANWTYGTRMSVLNIRMWSSEDVSGLGLTNGNVGLLRGMYYDILAQDLIVLIE